MPWIPIYADEIDARSLLEWLNGEPQIAFVVRERPGRLVAKATIDQLPHGRTSLWHTESGPIPHFQLKRGLFGSRQTEDFVSDPWAGWDEGVTSATGDPWFGPGHPGIIVLNYHPTSVERPDGIGVSSFEWIGNYFSSIGNPAPEATKKWWERLRRNVRKSSQLIPGRGPLTGADKDRYAYPSALDRIVAGTWRDLNFPLPPAVV